MEYTFLHPAMFFQNFAASWPKVVENGVHAEPWSTETRFSRVDFRDVAEVAATALTEDRLRYGTFELYAAGHTNRYDVAALMSEVLGKNIRAENADPNRAARGGASDESETSKLKRCSNVRPSWVTGKLADSVGHPWARAAKPAGVLSGTRSRKCWRLEVKIRRPYVQERQQREV
jgi:uncharacterized protein YbjT (DUF2867 family)